MRFAAITSACRIAVVAFRRLQLFRHLHSCSGCFRLERSPGYHNRQRLRWVAAKIEAYGNYL